MAVFALDKRKQPLMPCSEKRARRRAARGRAVVHRRHPLTIRLKDLLGGDVGPVRLRIDLSSNTTGIALITDADGNKPAKVLCLFEFDHRGRQISPGIAKTHALDAACVGRVGTLVGWEIPSTEIKASGRGDYCRTKATPHGFPRGYCVRTKSVRGFKTGDLVRADLPNGKRAGIHVGQVAVPPLTEAGGLERGRFG